MHEIGVVRGNHAPAVIGLDTEFGESVGWVGAKTERDQDDIGRNDFFGFRHDFWHAATAIVGCANSGRDHLDAGYFTGIGADQFDWLAVLRRLPSIPVLPRVRVCL